MSMKKMLIIAYHVGETRSLVTGVTKKKQEKCKYPKLSGFLGLKSARKHNCSACS